MTAYNIVRMRVKPGRDKDFLIKNKELGRNDMKGFRKIAVVKTGDRTYCVVGEWDSFDSIVAARPTMIGMLDGFREMLEDLGGGLGVTDPVSGEVVYESG
jgi:Antibiotic biosynthesis monooxygenase